MTTNFFQLLNSLYTAGRWTITIEKGEGDEMVVSVTILNCKPTDDRKNVKPRKAMIFRKPAVQLDEGFFSALVVPVQQTNELFTNQAQYASKLKEEKADVGKPKGGVSKEQREKEDKKRKYDEIMEKVKKLETEEKYGQAIAQMPDPEDFPEQAEHIKKKTEELKDKRNSPTLW